MNQFKDKAYLGDGAYAQYDGFGVMVTAENGYEVTDRVYLEPNVFEALVAYFQEVTNKETKSE